MNKPILFIIGAVLLGSVAFADIVTGYELASSIFYFIPVLFFSLLLGTSFGVVASMASAFLWYWSDLIAGHVYSQSFIPIWNAFVRLVIFLTVCLTVTRLQKELALQKQRNDEVLRANAEIQRLSKVKEEFTAIVSHELRTPMTAIRESVSLIQDGMLGPVHKDQEPYFEMIKRNVDRLIYLINDILDFSKLQEGKRKLDANVQQIGPIVEECFHLFKPLAGKKGIEMSLAVGQNLPCVICDTDGVKQVIGNVLSNAIKFTDRGEISIHIISQDRNVEVKITDTGRGIAYHDLKRVFEPFVQVEKKAESDVKGSGLGLSIAEKIMSQHDGKIWIDSVVGRGTTVHIVFPASDSPMPQDKLKPEYL